MTSKLLLLMGTSIALALPAMAQDTADPASGDDVRRLDEVVVTARRDEERLIDVPATINVFTEDDLLSADIDRAEDFILLTPGVSIITGTAEVGDTQINIRGINGTRDAESSVALVVDGILKTNTAQLNQNQGDLIQVEILKGPQGALYGRNAAAGAIVQTTRRPGDVLQGRAEASFAEDNTYEVAGSINGPISDTLGFVLSADYRTSDGFFENTGPTEISAGDTVDRLEAFNLQGRLIFDPTDQLSIDAKLRYGEVDAAAVAFNTSFALPGLAAAFGNPDLVADVNDTEFVFQGNIRPDNDQQTFEASVKFDYDFDWATLTAWGLYSDVEQEFSGDGTSAAFGFFNADQLCIDTTAALNAAGVTLPSPQLLGQTPNSLFFDPNGSILGGFTPTTCDGTQFQVRDQEDFSFEARLAGGDQYRWSIGAYYLNIDRQVGVALGLDTGDGAVGGLFTPAGQPNSTEQLAFDDFETDVFSIFGSLEADITDQLTASVALRWDREERSVENLVPADATTLFVDFDGVPFTGGAPLNTGLLSGPILPQSANFDEFQPKVSLTYKPLDNLSLFANWGIGFKAGGFNNQGSAATVDINFNNPAINAGVTIADTFEEETSSAFEAGFKSTFWDGRASFDVTGFYTDVDDLQFFEFFVGTFGLLRVVSNIDEVELYGFETSASVQPLDWLSLYSSFSLTESEIKENSARPNTVGNESPSTPDYTFNLGGQIDYPLFQNISATLRVDWRLTGPTNFATTQDEDVPTIFTAILPLAGLPAGLGTANFSDQERSSFSVVNLRLGLASGDGWRITAFADNIFDEDVLTEVIPAPEFGGSFISPGAQRRFGLQLGYSF